MTVLITLSVTGASTGPFNLYTNIDGYAVPFESNVPKASLVAGYTSILVPTGTTIVKVKSVGACTNGVNLTIVPLTTTAAPTTTVPTTTTTTTACVRTPGTTYNQIASGHIVNGITYNYTALTIAQICTSLQNYCFPNYGGMTELMLGFYATSLTVGVNAYSQATGCTPLANGNYVMGQPSQTCGGTATIITVLNGVITAISTSCSVTSTTTTATPTVQVLQLLGCCDSTTQYVAYTSALAALPGVYTATNGQPYQVVSATPATGIATVTILPGATNYNTCSNWLIVNGSCPPTTTTVPAGIAPSNVTQGYTTAAAACNNFAANGGASGGVGTATTIYVIGGIAYTASGSVFVGNPSLFYIITPYINITPGLESTCHISATGVVSSVGFVDCLTVNIP